MNSKSTSAYRDEVDLFELIRTVWNGRWFVLLGGSLFTSAGIAYAFLAPEWYEAEIVLAPADQQASTGGALAGLGLSGVAGLTGIDLQSSGGQQPIAVLKSREFASAFITDLDLLPELLGHVRAGSRQPDIRDAVKVFDEAVRTVNEEPQTGLVTLSIRWNDPDTAANWANTLIQRLNDRLRLEAEADAERNIAYLKNEIDATRVVSIQQSIASLLEAEMQKLMLAQGNEEFAFKVIDPAIPPIGLDAPKRVLIIAMSLVVGTIFTILILIAHRTIQTHDKRSQ